jgi:predicted nucleotidyltransferase
MKIKSISKMNDLQQIRTKLKGIQPSLLQRYPIKRLAIFGSTVRNEQTSDSDIDIMVEFSRPVGFQFFELADELENHLQCHVDLVSRNGIKPAYYAEIVNLF